MINTDMFMAELTRTMIGYGAVREVGKLVKKLGGSKALIVTDPGVLKAGLVEDTKHALENTGIEYGIFDRCVPDAPIQTIKDCALFSQQGNYDLMIGLGGGSTMDTTKIASIVAKSEDINREDINKYVTGGVPRRGQPKILIPTTSGTGSEVSVAAVFTDEAGVKKAVFGDLVVADMAIVDPLMTLNMPGRITADSGMDALSHAIEGFTSLKANIVSDMFAETTIKLVSENLRSAYSKGSRNLEARYNMAVAATMASKVFDFAVGANVNHGMGHTLQSAGIKCTHGVSCTIILPHIMEYNMVGNLRKYARIAELMGENVTGLSLREAAGKSIEALKTLSKDIDMPQSLSDIGVKKSDIPRLVDMLFTYSSGCIERNPRNVSREDAARIFATAL